MGALEYRRAEEIRDAFARHGVRYLFTGRSGAILLGFLDTTPKTPTSSSRSALRRRASAAIVHGWG